MTKDMLTLILIVFLSGIFTNQSTAQDTKTISVSEGDQVYLNCSIPGNFSFPNWFGPPSSTTYYVQGTTSRVISHKAPAVKRLRLATNDKDLILSDAKTNDSGIYQCSYPKEGDLKITLKVNKNGDSSTTSTNPATMILICLLYQLLSNL